MPEASDPLPPPPVGKPVEVELVNEKQASTRESYQNVADVVGGVPSLRWKDNLYQAAAIAAFVLVGAVVGGGIVFFQSSGPHRGIESLMGAAAGGFVGMMAGVLLSGFVLGILGIKRVANKK